MPRLTRTATSVKHVDRSTEASASPSREQPSKSPPQGDGTAGASSAPLAMDGQRKTIRAGGKSGSRLKAVHAVPRSVRSPLSAAPVEVLCERTEPDGNLQSTSGFDKELMVELIEILDEDTKSQHSADGLSDEVQEGSKVEEDSSGFPSSIIIADVKIDGTIEVGRNVQNEVIEEVSVENAIDGGTETAVHPLVATTERDISEVGGTRKSKRQVKVTNKFRDFVVDAPLPASQITYADFRVHRRKEPMAGTSSMEGNPDSPPLVMQQPLRTYVKRRSAPARTELADKTVAKGDSLDAMQLAVASTSGRGRKKASMAVVDPADLTVQLPKADEKENTTLSLNMDSSIFSEDDLSRGTTPSPPAVEFEVESTEQMPCTSKRGRGKAVRGRTVTGPVEPERPVGSTFIRRSYKTTRSSTGASVPPPTPAIIYKGKSKQEGESKGETKELDATPKVVAKKAPVLPLPADDYPTVDDIEGVIMLQADEIINDAIAPDATAKDSGKTTRGGMKSSKGITRARIKRPQDNVVEPKAEVVRYVGVAVSDVSSVKGTEGTPKQKQINAVKTEPVAIESQPTQLSAEPAPNETSKGSEVAAVKIELKQETCAAIEAPYSKSPRVVPNIKPEPVRTDVKVVPVTETPVPAAASTPDVKIPVSSAEADSKLCVPEKTIKKEKKSELNQKDSGTDSPRKTKDKGYERERDRKHHDKAAKSEDRERKKEKKHKRSDSRDRDRPERKHGELLERSSNVDRRKSEVKSSDTQDATPEKKREHEKKRKSVSERRKSEHGKREKNRTEADNGKSKRNLEIDVAMEMKHRENQPVATSLEEMSLAEKNRQVNKFLTEMELGPVLHEKSKKTLDSSELQSAVKMEKVGNTADVETANSTVAATKPDKSTKSLDEEPTKIEKRKKSIEQEQSKSAAKAEKNKKNFDTELIALEVPTKATPDEHRKRKEKKESSRKEHKHKKSQKSEEHERSRSKSRPVAEQAMAAGSKSSKSKSNSDPRLERRESIAVPKVPEDLTKEAIMKTYDQWIGATKKPMKCKDTTREEIATDLTVLPTKVEEGATAKHESHEDFDTESHDMPNFVTKASRKMYQFLEERSGHQQPAEMEAFAVEYSTAEPEVIKQQDNLQFSGEPSVYAEDHQKLTEVELKQHQLADEAFSEMDTRSEGRSESSMLMSGMISEDDSGIRSTTSMGDLSSNDDDDEEVVGGDHGGAPRTDSQRVDRVQLIESYTDDGTIRRSTRIKSISTQKQRKSGHGLVRDKDRFAKKTTISVGFNSKVLQDAVTGNFNVVPSCDGTDTIGAVAHIPGGGMEPDNAVSNIELSDEYLRDMEEKLRLFETIRENIYHSERIVSKEAKKMTCDCFLTHEEIERDELGCGEDCLNRMLMIECGSRCIVGDRCTNRRFQKQEYANSQIFRTEKKGFGIQANAPIAPGEFIMEYVGEVVNGKQFDDRAEIYSREKNKHYYFMALRSDAIIDATTKGNISRFINHSCDPNAETQKWTVNGELRIGFFCTKHIMPGEEITFDYQFQRYGRKAQRCYCEAETCRGWIGAEPGSDGESEYEVDDEGDDEESEEEELMDSVPVAVGLATGDGGIADQPATLGVTNAIPCDKEAGKLSATVAEGKAEAMSSSVLMAKVKKPRKVRQVIRKKRRPEIHEDQDLEVEINSLLKAGLKNQAHTLKLSRLMVRAKDIKSRSRLLTILQSGELACRRLFLDYHGLLLLYGWICESTESIEDLKFRIQILDTLDQLPITNKTMLKDSKILQTIEKWALLEKDKSPEKVKEREKEKQKEKETSSTSSPSDSNGGGSDSNASSSEAKKDVLGSVEVMKNMPALLKLADLSKLKQIMSSCDAKESEKEKPPTAVEQPALLPNVQLPEPDDENAPEEQRLATQIRNLARKLLVSWVNLKEVFRIPKRERIEQMKEHEREADLRYKALGLVEDEDKSHRNELSSRFFDRTREMKRRKSIDDRDLLQGYNKSKRPIIGSSMMMMKQDNLSKQQRRQLFEQKVAMEEAERRNKELWYMHESNCHKFGLNPHHTAAGDVPIMMNPATGEYYSYDKRLLPTPPSHAYLKIQPPPMSTNPADYELPSMDLPPLWKFAIDERGKLYYYHVKDRVPQWEPPKKPGRGVGSIPDEDISMSSDSSTTDTCDSSEEELNAQLEQLLKKKRKQQSSFNLDDVLAKPDDMNDDPSKPLQKDEVGDASPQALNLEDIFGEGEEASGQGGKKKRKHSLKLVQARIISPRTEEDKQYGQMEMKRYKETKEKLRKRKEEAKRLRARSMLDKTLADGPFGGPLDKTAMAGATGDSSLIDDDLVVSHKIVEDKCIVDELDILTKKKKISPYEEWKKVQQRLGKKRKQGESVSGSVSASASALGAASTSKTVKRKKSDKLDLNSDEARKIKERFRGEIASVIVPHLTLYRKETCQIGRITNTEDFKHLARKLTHFVMLKELKHCDNTINELEVTESVKTKARDFIKKYMAKYGPVYVRGENEADYSNITI